LGNHKLVIEEIAMSFTEMTIGEFDNKINDIAFLGNVKKFEELIMELHLDQSLSYEAQQGLIRIVKKLWNSHHS
jgi:hypothetical protein